MSFDLINLLENMKENYGRNLFDEEQQTFNSSNENNLNVLRNKYHNGSCYPSPEESPLELNELINYMDSSNVNGQPKNSSTYIDPISVSNYDGISNQSTINNFISGLNVDQNIVSMMNESNSLNNEQKMAFAEKLMAQLSESIYDNSCSIPLENETPVNMSLEDMLNDIKNNGISLLESSCNNEQKEFNSYNNNEQGEFKSQANEQNEFKSASNDGMNGISWNQMLNMLQNETNGTIIIDDNITQEVENTVLIDDINSSLLSEYYSDISDG